MKPLIGTVISTKMAKTATVSVTNKWQHPLYKKTVKRTKKYLVHDDLGVTLGQQVTITQTKPVSKRKRWKIESVLTNSDTATNTKSITATTKNSKSTKS